MIGGACKILVYVAVSVFLVLRRPMLAMHTIEEINSYLTEVSGKLKI